MFADLDAEHSAKSGSGYQVLARKYRPASFADLKGQEAMVRTLTNAFTLGRIPQAWMLTGVRGVGKTTTARILARGLNYETDEGPSQPTVAMPNYGVHCKAIMEGRHPDVFEMDAASHTGINDIREIIDQVRYRPTSARYKVYLIDEVHMLSTQAFNGLLKTLEEPPEHVKFIFATTEIRKVPITVLSRCQRFDLRRIEAEVMMAHLGEILANEQIDADEEAISLVVRAGEGSARDCLSLLDQAIATAGGRITAEIVRSMLGLADRARIVDLFEAIMGGKVAEALAIIADLYDGGADPSVVLVDLAGYTHYVTRLKLAPSARLDAMASEVERSQGSQFAEKLTVRALGRAWQILTRGIEETKSAPQPLASAEMVLIRLAYAADLPTPDEALKMLRGSAPGAPTQQATSQGAGSGAAGAAGQTARSTSPPIPSSGQPTPSTSQTGNNAPDWPRLAAVEGGRSVVTLAQPSTPVEHAPQPQPQKAVQLRGLRDLVALAESHRDLRLKHAIETYLRPIRIDHGLIEVEPTSDAPIELTQKLGQAVSKWLGERWSIVIGTDGGATLAEEASATRTRLVDDARSNPTVAAVLAAFPGAEIVDVRMPSHQHEEDTGASEHLEPVDEFDDDDLDHL